ncbi:ornithine cyclodeaminase [Sphingomonas jinjuensis]|uniref:Ornithine cyclodeaminase n=1 Tax=Sphingomonas jinjuensis TaxID=535907 RepID=A0A840FIP7_9SPHN|nr:ornithine cyclodeaminase family protein [Sphingomonas jinjuensis]MBB4155567.1 ornithine cyclodeaminase [Sphingomonas jinjuensis]
MTGFPFYDRDAVERLLDYPGCIGAMRAAMCQFSAERREQPLRQIIEPAPAKLFALMPGMLSIDEGFGAKVITVFPDLARDGRAGHRGLVILFDPESGDVAAMADAGAITEIRTACTTAVATDALARADARTLGVFGCGAQAATHLRAIALVRPLEDVRIWGRDEGRAEAFAQKAEAETGLPIRAVADPREAAEADIVTTVTSSAQPVLFRDWLQPGAHVNLVGSSYAGPMEVDTALVAATRFIVDSRRSALVAAAEFIAARSEGLIDDGHIVAELGEVLSGEAVGRIASGQLTTFKSLGHIVQDLAALRYIHAA